MGNNDLSLSSVPDMSVGWVYLHQRWLLYLTGW